MIINYQMAHDKQESKQCKLKDTKTCSRNCPRDQGSEISHRMNMLKLRN